MKLDQRVLNQMQASEHVAILNMLADLNLAMLPDNATADDATVCNTQSS